MIQAGYSELAQSLPKISDSFSGASPNSIGSSSVKGTTLISEVQFLQYEFEISFLRLSHKFLFVNYMLGLFIVNFF